MLIVGLLVKTTTRGSRHDADELCVDIYGGALILEQLLGPFALPSHDLWGDGVRHAQLTTVYVSERQLSIAIYQLGGQRNRVTAIRTAVHSHKHVLEHHMSPCRVDNNLDRDRPSTIR